MSIESPTQEEIDAYMSGSNINPSSPFFRAKAPRYTVAGYVEPYSTTLHDAPTSPRSRAVYFREEA